MSKGKGLDLKSNRLVADPCVTVADLTAVFKTWLETNLTKDLFAMLKPTHGKPFSWKTAPDHQWLADLAPLFLALAKVVPNTVLTSKKMLLVFENMHKDGKVINTSKMEDSVFFEWCDQTVRIIFSKYREVKKDTAMKNRLEKRCTSKQLKAIELVLQSIRVSEETQDQEVKSTVTLSPPKSWGAWQCIEGVPQETIATSSTSSGSAVSPTILPANTNMVLPKSCDIFQQILKQQDLKDEIVFQQEPTKSEAPVSLSSGHKFTSPVKSKSSTHFGKWKMAEQTPPEAMSPDSAKFQDLNEQDTKIIDAIMSQAAASANAKASPKKPKAKAKAKMVQSKAVSKPKKEKSSQLQDKKGDLKRFTSKAYHKAYKAAMATGADTTEAKEAAREAYKQAAQDFEKSS